MGILVEQLTGLWRFSPDPNNVGIEQQWMAQDNQPYLENKTREMVPVAGIANRQKNMQNFTVQLGIGAFFRIPSDFVGREVYLRFCGVIHDAIIYIDGQEMGQFKGGFMLFEFDITRFTDNKDHFLAVRIDGSNEANRYPTGTISKPYNGIIGPVELRSNEKVYLENWSYNTKLHLDENGKAIKYAEIEFALYLKNISDYDFKGKISIMLTKDFVIRTSIEKDVEVLKQNSRLAKIVIMVDRPDLWTPEEPNVISARIHIWNAQLNAVETDELIGLNEIKFQNNQFIVNGKPYELRGYDFEIEQPAFGFVLPETVIIDKLERLKEIKVNVIRPNQGCFLPFIVEMASRLGFFVIEDLPLTNLSLAERDIHYKLLIDNIKTQPSLIGYSVSPQLDQKNPTISNNAIQLHQLISTKFDLTHLFFTEGYLNAKSWVRNEEAGFKDILASK